MSMLTLLAAAVGVIIAMIGALFGSARSGARAAGRAKQAQATSQALAARAKVDQAIAAKPPSAVDADLSKWVRK